MWLGSSSKALRKEARLGGQRSTGASQPCLKMSRELVENACSGALFLLQHWQIAMIHKPEIRNPPSKGTFVAKSPLFPGFPVQRLSPLAAALAGPQRSAVGDHGEAQRFGEVCQQLPEVPSRLAAVERFLGMASGYMCHDRKNTHYSVGIVMDPPRSPTFCHKNYEDMNK